MNEDKLILGMWCLIFCAFLLWPASRLASLLMIAFVLGLIYVAGRINDNW